MAKESVKSREERAKNSTSPAELEKLTEDKNEDVRLEVACNTNTPVSLLEKLAEDKESYVRYGVGKNVNIPVALLEKLAEEDPTFRVETDEETNQTLISGMGCAYSKGMIKKNSSRYIPLVTFLYIHFSVVLQEQDNCVFPQEKFP